MDASDWLCFVAAFGFISALIIASYDNLRPGKISGKMPTILIMASAGIFLIALVVKVIKEFT